MIRYYLINIYYNFDLFFVINYLLNEYNFILNFLISIKKMMF